MGWRNIVCDLCLVPYRDCPHWPGYPNPKPSPEGLKKLYREWKRPPTVKKLARPVVPRGVKPPRPVNPLNLDPAVHAWFVALGQRGGSSRSEKKVAASRRNLLRAREGLNGNQAKGD